MIKILIIEDEELPALQLKAYIKRYDAKMEIVGWERSIQTAYHFLETNGEPDLIISDIELLDGNVFKLYDMRPVRCPIIFSTAYQQFMVEAFKGSGLAYLLKPYNYTLFSEAMNKFSDWFVQKQPTTAPTIMDTHILQQLQTALLQTQKKSYKERLTVKKAHGVFILPVTKIRYIVAKGNFTKAFDDTQQTHILSQNMGVLEQELDPSLFFRINRSELVQITAIERFENATNDRLSLYIKGLREPLFVAAAKVSEFRKWVG